MNGAVIARKYRSWRDSDYKLRKLVTWLIYHLRRRRLWDSLFALDRPARFAEIYRNNLWNNEESISGAGSTLRNTLDIRGRLPALLADYGVTSIVDAGCGDFHWMKELDLDVDYTGLDIVPDLIDLNARKHASARRRFQVCDITRDPIPRADLVLCRDCLFHCSFEDILAALRNIQRSGAIYLLATHSPESSNVDIQTGWCRPVNLESVPFKLPPPMVAIPEKWGRSMGLWLLADLKIPPVA